MALVVANHRKTMKPLSKKIAVVGFGYWGQKLAAASKAAGLTVVVVDNLPVEASTYLQKSWPMVLEDTEISGVIIATPEKTHAEYVLAALRAHKAVLVEKPATTSVTTWKSCVNLAEKNQVPLLVDYTFLYSQALNYLLQLQQKYRDQLGELCKLKTVRKSQLSVTRITGKALPIWWDVVIHDLYLLRAVFQQTPTAWQAKTTKLPSQLVATAKLGSTVLEADYSWQTSPERFWRAEYTAGTLLWERVGRGEHFVVTVHGKIVVDEIIPDQNPSPLDTLIQTWLNTWETPNSPEQQTHWQAVLTDITTLEQLDKTFMAQIAIHSPDQH